MQVPKPLLILVVVLIILGVIAFGASLFAFPDDGNRDNDQDDVKGNLTDFLGGVFPDPDPVLLRSPEASLAPPDCLVGQELRIDSGDTCVVEVLETDSLRRELELRVTQGLALFKVRQQGGETPEPTKEVPFNDDGRTIDSVSVVVSRRETATVTVQCVVQTFPVNCRLAVNPEDD
jgi:hypothetical protein